MRVSWSRLRVVRRLLPMPALTIFVAFSISAATSAQAGRALHDETALDNSPAGKALTPSNFIATPILRPVVEAMWQQSPTFKAQCARLRSTPSLVVDMRIGNPSQVRAARAITEFVRSSGGLTRAMVYIELASVTELVEVIAHELEHVIEWLDEAELTPSDRHGVYVTASGAFETARAIYIGQQVVRETARPSSIARTARRR
jgi:hypothetical protein